MQGTGCYREMMGPVHKGGDPKATTAPTPHKRHPLTFPHSGRDLYVSVLRLDHICLNFCDLIVPLESRVLAEWNWRWIHFGKRGDWESDVSWDRVPARRDWVIQSSSRVPLAGLPLTHSGTEILCCFLNESPSHRQREDYYHTYLPEYTDVLSWRLYAFVKLLSSWGWERKQAMDISIRAEDSLRIALCG